MLRAHSREEKEKAFRIFLEESTFVNTAKRSTRGEKWKSNKLKLVI